MLGKIYNANANEVLPQILSELEHPVIVTDPPFNIGYRYDVYKDNVDAEEYLNRLKSIVTECPSVIIHYPESLYEIAITANLAPEKVVSWVYNSNCPRQHRDICFFGIKPIFEQVRRPYKDMKDKRNIARMERTGGARSYDWLYCNQVKNVSKEKVAHPCQMPLAVMEDVIKWLPRDKNITVIDPYAGSGTTVVACEKLGIPWRAIEISQDYCDIIERRLETLEKNQGGRL